MRAICSVQELFYVFTYAHCICVRVAVCVCQVTLLKSPPQIVFGMDLTLRGVLPLLSTYIAAM